MRELHQLMVDYRFSPNQKLGQNFVVEESLVGKILAAAAPEKNDVILEIGAGTGFLTRELLEKCRVVAVEKDETLVRLLKEKFSGKNFRLIEGDFLTEKIPRVSKIVSLPPYYASSEIMLRIFRLEFKTAVLVFQKEFAEKLVAEPGFREYGFLSVLSRLSFRPAIVGPGVSPNNFYPKPESFSSIVRLERKKSFAPEELENLEFFVKNLFRFRNKNVLNAAKSCAADFSGKFGKSRGEILGALQGEKLAEEKVYLLEPEHFLELFRKIFRG